MELRVREITTKDLFIPEMNEKSLSDIFSDRGLCNDIGCHECVFDSLLNYRALESFLSL